VRTTPLLPLLLAACGRPPLGDAQQAEFAAHADPATWQDLDPANPGHCLRDPRSGVAFVRIEAGDFVMGSERVAEQPPRHVRLTHPYPIAETELTVAQWQRRVRDIAADPEVPIPPGADALPMQASWNDAVGYCRTFGYRLPTEAELEYAALGGLPGTDPSWREPATNQAHGFVHTYWDGPRPVGQKLKNSYGLHDLLGNVAEWCSDFMSADYRGRPAPDVDPQGPDKGTAHMLRGGSWYTLPRPQPQTRTLGNPDERNAFYGFRPARSLP